MKQLRVMQRSRKCCTQRIKSVRFFVRKVKNGKLRVTIGQMEATREELIRRCKSISPEEAEGNKFSFKGRMKERGLQIAAGCLIGKVLHTRNVNAEGLRIALNQVWQTNREVKIENIGGDNIFIFKFGNEADERTRPQLVWLSSLPAAINMKN